MFEKAIGVAGGLWYLSKVDSTIKRMKGWQQYGSKSIREVFGETGRFDELMQGIVIMRELKLPHETAAAALMMAKDDIPIKDAIIAHVKAFSALSGRNVDNIVAAIRSTPELVRS